MKSLVWLSLGSNLGDREQHINRAGEALENLLESPVWAPLYETAPRDFLDQGKFLNTVVRGSCALAPREILQRVLHIEKQCGREREKSVPKGPRIIDIDILLYGGLLVEEPGLSIPHPAMGERLFVLRPLLDLDPGLTDPRSGRPWKDFLPGIAGQEIVLHAENEVDGGPSGVS